MRIKPSKSKEEWRELNILVSKILGLLSALIGILIIGFGLYQHFMAKKSESWPITEGTIVYSKLVNGKNSDNEITYRPLVKYSFVVDGNTFVSNQIYFGEMSEQHSAKLPIKYIKQFPVSSKVTIFYHPFNPKNSVLIPYERNFAFQKIMIGAVFFLFGTGFLVYIFRKEKQMEFDKI